MSDQRYLVIPDHLAALGGKPLTYLVVDTDDDDPGVLCTTTDHYAGRIANALNDWGKCDRLHDEIHRMGVAREQQRQKTADRHRALEAALDAAGDLLVALTPGHLARERDAVLATIDTLLRPTDPETTDEA